MMAVAARMQSLGWYLYMPVAKMRQLIRTPRLVSPDLRSLDICWNQIFRDHTYEHASFTMPARDAVIFDVGANVGVFAAWASDKYKPARMFCYEPDPVTFPYLARNIAETAKSRPATAIQPLQLAMSDTPGQHLTLYHSPGLCAGSTMMPVGKAFGWQAVDVVTTTVSEQMTAQRVDQIDLLKIDVEGHAPQVLRGIADADFARIRNIVLECDYIPEGGVPAESLRQMLSERGYETEFDDPTLTNNLTLYAWRR